MKTNGNDLASPFHPDPKGMVQPFYGLTKKEWMATKLMAASIAANNLNIPENMTTQKAREHARSAVMMTRILIEELNQ